MDWAALEAKTLRLKRNIFRQAEAAGGGYVAQGLSSAEVVAALFFRVLRLNPRQPDWPERDRFVLSVGHYAITVYAALAELGFFEASLLDTYSADGSRLEMIATEFAPGIEVGGGSLGQGLSQAVGMALSARRRGASWRTYALLSDGELEEGQTWEAAMVASHYELDNLCVIVDVNRVQADGYIDEVTGVEPVAPKWSAFGWEVREIDGNDLRQVLPALEARPPGRPYVVLASTRMGNGVSFLEDRPDVHYVRWSPADTARALEELEEGKRAAR